MGGHIVAVCSEPDKIVQDTRKKWKVQYEMRGDRDNEVAKRCGVRITWNEKGFENDFPNGFAQPGIVCFVKKSNGAVASVFEWISTEENERKRPLLGEVWKSINRIVLANQTDDRSIFKVSQEEIGKMQKMEMTVSSAVASDLSGAIEWFGKKTLASAMQKKEIILFFLFVVFVIIVKLTR